MKELQSLAAEINARALGGLIAAKRGPLARVLFAWCAGQVIALSLLHHMLDFWEWGGARQLLLGGLAGAALTIPIHIVLSRTWHELTTIPRGRWALFCLPAVLGAGLLAAQILRVPESEHDLLITPGNQTSGSEVRIREIRGAYGNTLVLNQFASVHGWRLESGLLMAMDQDAAPLRAHFRGPVEEQVRVSFLTSERGGIADVQVDGRSVHVNLLGPDRNETRARLNTAYRWGGLNGVFVPFLLVIDALAIFCAFGVIWVAHELGSGGATEHGPMPPNYTRGLILVCSIALLGHAWNFVNVPLRVTKDGPSYLEGAVHYATHGNFDGASSYRGPATTFLFAPSFKLLGRNPLGVKLTLHLLAAACAALAYAIGWRLARRRWVALAAGLLTALSPDLYSYANDVLSEVPHIFSLLLLGATLLGALRHYTFPNLLACLAAGSLGVLVRPDNVAAFGLALAFLLVYAIFLRGATAEATGSGIIGRLRTLAIATVIAVLPLLGWSAHNLRVHGFFGISNYMGAVLYDGWIYYGENSGIQILDRDSEAVREIDAIIPIVVPTGEQPTGPAVVYALYYRGYKVDDAFALVGEAAVDSIRRHPKLALDILVRKFGDAQAPEATLPVSVASGPSNPYAELTRQFFDGEPWLLPRESRERYEAWNRHVLQLTYVAFYSVWLAVAFLSVWLALYRRPAWSWIGYAVLVANALLLPIVVGVASWRYHIPGIILSVPLVFAVLDAFVRFGLDHVPWKRASATAAMPR